MWLRPVKLTRLGAQQKKSLAIVSISLFNFSQAIKVSATLADLCMLLHGVLAGFSTVTSTVFTVQTPLNRAKAGHKYIKLHFYTGDT